MARRSKDLETWCYENEKDELLYEWDEKKNPLSPKRVSYNSANSVYWKCKKGHEWRGPVVARTLFGRTCPICNPEMSALPVGTKYGCLTIIGDYTVYENEVAKEKILSLEKEKEDFINGKRKPFSNVDSVDYYDRWIEDYENCKYYKCQCKCGLTQYLDEFHFLEKKHKYCTDGNSLILQSVDYPTMAECGLKKKQREKLLASYKRVFDKSYDTDYTHTFHESLEVLECVDDHYEELTSWSDKRKKGGGTYIVYKLYRCRCYLCGREQLIKSSQFFISPPTEYGSHAYNGYYSGAYCNCHKISSFQWIVNKILMENNVPYRVEKSFPDLHGRNSTVLLRYDFAIFNSDGSIKCLLECQGEQHYKPVEEFGGMKQFEIQKQNDNLKRKYAAEHGITLLEIPYKIKKYENVKTYLRDKSIIELEN